MAQESSPTKESPSDFVIRVLEQIEHAEDCVIVLRNVVDGKDEIDWMANNVQAWKITGMLQFAQLQIVMALMDKAGEEE